MDGDRKEAAAEEDLSHLVALHRKGCLLQHYPPINVKFAAFKGTLGTGVMLCILLPPMGTPCIASIPGAQAHHLAQAEEDLKQSSKKACQAGHSLINYNERQLFLEGHI